MACLELAERFIVRREGIGRRTGNAAREGRMNQEIRIRTSLAQGDILNCDPCVTP